VVRRTRGELRGAGVDRLVDRPDVQSPPGRPDVPLGATDELGDLPVGEAVPLGAQQQLTTELPVRGRLRGDLGRDFVDEQQLVEEPRVDAAGRAHRRHARAGPQRVEHVVQPSVGR
jgi:hypothetical protein